MSCRLQQAIAGLALGCCILTWAAAPTRAEVVFQFTYEDPAGVGFNDPTLGAARRASLEGTAAAMGGRIGQNATVMVRVFPSQFDGTEFIGIAGSVHVGAGMPGAAGISDGEMIRRIVLGLPDTAPAQFDAFMTYDFGYPIAYSDTPAPNESHFPYVVRHEITHALGYGSFLTADGTGRNGTMPDVYTRFDGSVRTQAGQAVIDAGGNQTLAPAVYSDAFEDGLVFDGTATRAANGGQPLALFPSGPTHSGVATDIMYPFITAGVARNDWTDREVAVLTDLGYQILPIPEPGAGLVAAGGVLVLSLRRRRGSERLGRRGMSLSRRHLD